ncbi:MAG: ATP-binding protein [Thermodesulfobacteriota bacterium]|jgi:predicted AAA+ superfamily ATPase
MLQTFPAVYINGPRQAGKTTLVHELLADRFRGRFITFDDALERGAASRNPAAFLGEAGVPLILDEVQLVPELFRPLKMLVDEQRLIALRGDANPNGRYLLTGSANLMVVPELADAMVGRMGTVTLLPLSGSEYCGTSGGFLDRCLARDFTGIGNDTGLPPLLKVMAAATFPGLARLPPAAREKWFQEYANKVTLEDPQHIYRLEKASQMPVLLQALAARAGNLLNDADLSRDTGLTPVTARTYRNLLNGSFITHFLPPWFRNIGKRLVKAGKIYFHDTMLLAHLLRTSPPELARTRPQLFGHLLENFVLAELTKMNSRRERRAEISFYRTRDGKEIDFVVEQAGRLVAIEVKNSEGITERDLAGIREFQSVTGKDFLCGVVLCNTRRVLSFDRNIHLVPLSALWQ